MLHAGWAKLGLGDLSLGYHYRDMTIQLNIMSIGIFP